MLTLIESRILCTSKKRTRNVEYTAASVVLATQWANRINQWACDGGEFLILVDEAGRSVWENHTKPLFDMVPSLTYDVVSLQQDDLAERFDACNGIVVVGANPLLTAVVNLTSISKDAAPLLQIPVNKTSSLACAILENWEDYSPLNASFAALKGCIRPLDLAHCEFSDGSTRTAYASIEYGLTSDALVRKQWKVRMFFFPSLCASNRATNPP